jgi:hypothetical protein
MAGLVPAIHVLISRFSRKKGVDARDKPGHGTTSPGMTDKI